LTNDLDLKYVTLTLTLTISVSFFENERDVHVVEAEVFGLVPIIEHDIGKPLAVCILLKVPLCPLGSRHSACKQRVEGSNPLYNTVKPVNSSLAK
jgi:hypothetical protein